MKQPKCAMVRIEKRCNQNCIFCNVSSLSSTEYPLNKEDLALKLSAIDPDVDTVLLSGGEPTLNRNLGIIVAYLRKKGIKRIEMQTNALMMYSTKYVKYLKSLGLENYLVSLHSCKESISDALTRSPGTFQKTVEGIKNMLNEGLQVSINHVITKLNYKEIPQFVDFCKANFKKATICFSFIQPNMSGWKNRRVLVPKVSEIIPYLKKAMDKCIKENITFCVTESGIPVCFIEEFKKYHQEYQKGVQGISDPLIRRNIKNKVKSDDCQRCIYTGYCLGIWKNYAKIYGLDELKPITRSSSERLSRGAKEQ